MDGNKTLICVLFDIYGELLTQPVADSVDMYYNEDLSLSEIAENIGISRQGVRDDLKRGVEFLYHYEDKLRLYEKYRANSKLIEQCRTLLKEDPADVKRVAALLDSFSL